MKKKLLLLLLSLVIIGITVFSLLDSSFTTLFVAQDQDTFTQPIKKARYGKSYLEFTNGIPILHLYGSSYEKGQAAGFILRKQIQILMKHYIYVLFNKKNYRTGLKKAYQLEKYIPKEYIEEMKGMSETSEVPYQDILLANTFLDMKSVILCSTFVVQKENSKENALLFARNLDFPSLGVAQKYDLLIVYHSNKNHDVLTITWPSLIGSISGMNNYGLTATMLVSLSESESSTKRIPSTLAFRKLLESAKNLKETTEFFSKVKIASPNNLTVADAKNNAGVYELSPFNKTKVRYPHYNSLYCTNFFTQQRGREQGNRYKRLQKFADESFSKKEKLGLSSLKKILQNVAIKNLNLQAMIFIPSEKKLYLSIEKIPASAGSYKLLDLKPLFKKN